MGATHSFACQTMPLAPNSAAKDVGETKGDSSGSSASPGKLNRHVASTVPCGPALSNLILAGAWVFSPICSVAASVITCIDFGTVGSVVAGLAFAGGVAATPRSYPMRGTLCALMWGVAIRGGSSLAKLGATVSTVFIYLVTRKPFAGSPAMFTFFTETLAGSAYYGDIQLRGALDGIKPGKNFYCVHPHGCLSVAFTWNFFWNTAFHEKAGRTCFFIDDVLRQKCPFFRPIIDMWTNENRYCTNADGRSIKKAMEKGDSLCIIPGGFEDATLMVHGKERTAMKKRKGFVKYCLEYGYQIIPTYSFGEGDTYYTFPWFLNFRLWLNQFGIPAIAFFGNPMFPLLARKDAKILTFVGPPLVLPDMSKSKPSKEEMSTLVDEWHGKYLEALQALFDKHKAEAGKPDAKLEIW